jgi:apolipoprotein N-acyltransferase
MLKAVIISPYFVAFILGGAAGLCLPPVNSIILTLIILIAFFYGFLRFAPKKPAFYAYNFALGFFLTGLYWIGNALLVEGNDYKWAWPLAVFALPAGLALFYALSATLTLKLLGKDVSPFSRLICFTQSIMIAELARSFLFTGFPWNLLGTTWSNFLPTIQLASVIGLLGMTWLILIISAFIGYGLYTPIKRQRFIALSLACVLCAGNILFGYITLQNAPVKNPPSIHVITVQPNIPQSEKWNPLYAKRTWKNWCKPVKMLSATLLTKRYLSCSSGLKRHYRITAQNKIISFLILWQS